MAYKVTVNKAVVNKAEAMAEIHTQLLAMGWEYVDGQCDEYDIPYTDVDTTNNTFTKVGHTYVNSQPVYIRTTGTIPGGLAVNTQYFVVNVSGDTFKLSTTYNGAAINLTDQGTGTHTIFEYFRIYKSNGEAGDMPYQYIAVIQGLHATQISFIGAYNFNLATKNLEGYTYSGYKAVITTNQTGFYIWIHGDKDKVHISSKVVSTYYRGWFGFMKPFLTLKTSLSEAANLGFDVVLTVADSTGFEVGYSYQIVGMIAEGRDNVLVTAVGTGTITVSSLLRNYGIGALIGICPVSFVVATESNASITCPLSSVGLDSGGYGFGAYGAVFLSNFDALDPEVSSNKYILQPFGLVGIYDTAGSGIQGYIDTNMLIAPSNGMVIEDTFAVGRMDSGTSSGSNSTTEMNDNTKSWTINAFANKVVIIIFGLGSGMIKKITSNTATKIVLDAGNVFESVPDVTSQYIICEEGYRYMAHGMGTGGGNYMALREGI